MDGAAVALEANRAEIKRTVRRQLGERLLGLRSRQQHRVAEMPPRLIMREDVRDQNALVDLEAVLVALEHVLIRRDLCALRHKPRKRIGSGKQEFFHPHEASHAMGDGAVDRARMRAQEPVAGFADAGPDRFCRLLLRRRARRLLRHHVDQPLRPLPERAIALAIGNQVAGLGRLVSQPFGDLSLGQCVGENVHG